MKISRKYNIPACNALPARHTDASHAGWRSNAGRKYPIFLIFFVLFFSSFLFGIEFVKATTQEQCDNEKTTCLAEITPGQDTAGTPPPVSTKGLKGASGRLGAIGAQIGETKPFEEVVGGYVKGALVLVGTVFLVLMVYGGYIWMIARGDEQEATRAKDIITMATIGIAIVLAAYAITYFVVARLTGATGTLASITPTVFAVEPESLKLLQNAGNSAGYASATTNVDTMAATIGRIINWALGLLGVIFLFLTVYAGYLWLTAGGDEEKVTKAKAYLYNGLIGLIIVLASYGLARFIVSAIISSTMGE